MINDLIEWFLFVGYSMMLPGVFVFVYSVVLWVLDKYVDRGPFGDTTLAIFIIAFLVGFMFVYVAGAVALYPTD